MKRPIIFLWEDAEKHMPQKRLKSQSAMEYLMTYGWAILIIAVVLGALFFLGVFNPNNFAPKAKPGSCQVLRPYGPGTSAYVTLQGTCINEMPKFVAQFNGASAYIASSVVNLPVGDIVSITAWVKPGTYINCNSMFCGIIAYGARACSGNSIVLSIQPDYLPSMATWCNDYIPTSGPSIVPNQWNFVAVVLNVSTATLYVGSQHESNVLALRPDIVSENLCIGCTDYPGRYFNGSIADIQIYNASLSQPEVTALYRAGIGGDPIDLQNLVGWWPLNGNANDYSGNQNSGTNSNVIYTTGWTSSYSAP